MDMKGSQTEQNLMKAFAGESQARNRYTYAADVAAEEGYRQIANLFRETAENERAHAFQFFSLLDGGMPEFTASYPAGPVGTTAENLLAAAEGELAEWGTLYPDFADVADREGFNRVAAVFRRITTARSTTSAATGSSWPIVQAKKVFRKDGPTPLEVRGMRLRPRGRAGSEDVPALRQAAGLLRALRRELLADSAASGRRAPISTDSRSTAVVVAGLRWRHACYSHKTVARIHRHGGRGAGGGYAGAPVHAGRGSVWL